MDLALMIAKSGLEAHHKNIEIISNNLANANTPAFKKNRGEFEELPYEVIKQPGAAATETTNAPAGLVIGTGTKLANDKKIFSQGNPVQTDRELDIAIIGRGFLKVQLPNGTDFAYTRAGSMTKNETGQLITANGNIIQPPITIPQGTTRVEITEDGIVNTYQSGTQVPQQAGQIQLTDFINPDGLHPIGENLYLATVSSGLGTQSNPGIDGLGTIQQNTLEGSNVNVVEEMVNLIEAQRAFEITSKAVSAVDNMLQYLEKST